MPFNEAVGAGCIDIARVANQWIWDFVHQPDNRKLRAGTGYYSTPFRGGLFGKVKADEVAKQLSRRDVDVLWLGTNPCVPGSLDNIIKPPPDGGHFATFERQMKSGFFGSLKWRSNGEPEADFSPIERPTSNWKVYRDLLEQIGDIESVAMANFIPWGSQNTKALIKRLGTEDPRLLQRALEFSDALNAQVVQALKPRLLVVPFSLGRNPRTHSLSKLIKLSLAQATDVKQHTVCLPKANFNFYTAICQRGKLAVRTLFVPHPASLRVCSESKVLVVAGVMQALGGFD